MDKFIILGLTLVGILAFSVPKDYSSIMMSRYKTGSGVWRRYNRQWHLNGAGLRLTATFGLFYLTVTDLYLMLACWIEFQIFWWLAFDPLIAMAFKKDPLFIGTTSATDKTIQWIAKVTKIRVDIAAIILKFTILVIIPILYYISRNMGIVRNLFNLFVE